MYGISVRISTRLCISIQIVYLPLVVAISCDKNRNYPANVVKLVNLPNSTVMGCLCVCVFMCVRAMSVCLFNAGWRPLQPHLLSQQHMHNMHISRAHIVHHSWFIVVSCVTFFERKKLSWMKYYRLFIIVVAIHPRPLLHFGICNQSLLVFLFPTFFYQCLWQRLCMEKWVWVASRSACIEALGLMPECGSARTQTLQMPSIHGHPNKDMGIMILVIDGACLKHPFAGPLPHTNEWAMMWW